MLGLTPRCLFPAHSSCPGPEAGCSEEGRREAEGEEDQAGELQEMAPKVYFFSSYAIFK